MRKIITILFATACLTLTNNVYAEVKTKRVCVVAKDKAGNIIKDSAGKPKQNCRTMRVHRKLDGTQIPGKK